MNDTSPYTPSSIPRKLGKPLQLKQLSRGNNRNQFNLTGMKRGYIQSIRSVVEFQNQVKMMNDAGVESDKITINRPFIDFNKTLDAGDVAVIFSLDCFENLTALINTSIEFSERGIELRSLTEKWYDTSLESLTIVQGIIDLTHRIRSNRTQSGLIKLKAQGKKLGRPVGSVKIHKKAAEVEKLHKESKMSIVKACASVGCNPRSYYRYIKDNNPVRSDAKQDGVD